MIVGFPDLPEREADALLIWPPRLVLQISKDYKERMCVQGQGEVGRYVRIIRWGGPSWIAYLGARNILSGGRVPRLIERTRSEGID